ncbi:MAG TPA: hypothetical protein VMR33_06050 [Candidatus Baltobacteraceae bacterium]|jgi:hypothetical protein|nr:hypothetical protein [Candidatus Baltobacteraceae bacterium]
MVRIERDDRGQNWRTPRAQDFPPVMASDLLISRKMDDVNDSRWDKISTRKFAGFWVGIVLFALLVFNSEPGFVACLDYANLLFHEAGHPAVGLFSRRLEVYGGTLGQLTFPVVLAVSFWRKGEAVSVAASVIWFFENWLNIARYMADARAQVLPLVGGGCHDWAEIFGRWRVLSHDTQIAAAVRTTGWIGMAAACAWLTRIWWVGRRSGLTDAKAALSKSEVDLLRKNSA